MTQGTDWRSILALMTKLIGAHLEREEILEDFPADLHIRKLATRFSYELPSVEDVDKVLKVLTWWNMRRIPAPLPDVASPLVFYEGSAKAGDSFEMIRMWHYTPSLNQVVFREVGEISQRDWIFLGVESLNADVFHVTNGSVDFECTTENESGAKEFSLKGENGEIILVAVGYVIVRIEGDFTTPPELDPDRWIR